MAVILAYKNQDIAHIRKICHLQMLIFTHNSQLWVHAGAHDDMIAIAADTTMSSRNVSVQTYSAVYYNNSVFTSQCCNGNNCWKCVSASKLQEPSFTNSTDTILFMLCSTIICYAESVDGTYRFLPRDALLHQLLVLLCSFVVMGNLLQVSCLHEELGGLQNWLRIASKV